MNLFNFFKPRKTKNQLLYESIEYIVSLLHEKKTLVETGIIDLSFESHIKQKLIVATLIKDFDLEFRLKFEYDLLLIFNTLSLDSDLILRVYRDLEIEKAHFFIKSLK